MDITEISELADNWCRMWNEDPALAHNLMTDDCVQWSANTPGLDTVVRPQQQEDFITAYRTQHVNVFSARVIIADGDRFAYLWDVVLPDGTVKTGVDINVLRGNLIRRNWTFVADNHKDAPDPAPGASINADVVTEWVQAQGNVVHEQPVIDASTGRAAVMRTAADGSGGVDLLTVRDGVVEPIWSITGIRPFRY